MRLTCAICGIKLAGRQKKFCSEACRTRKPVLDTSPAVAGINQGALEIQISALNPGDEVAALVASCRTLARYVDAGLEDVDADKVWREYRLALAALLGACSDGDPLDPFGATRREFADLDAELDAKMGHTKNG